MEERVRIAQNKRIRGEIIALLHAAHPAGILIKTLANILLDANYTTTADVAPYVDYLLDKGYVKTIDPEVMERAFGGIIPPETLIKLTAEGIDLIEGTTTDDGVDV